MLRSQILLHSPVVVATLQPLLSAGEGLWYAVQFLFQVLIVAVVIWIGWRLFRPRPAFQIKIRQGAVTVVVGRVRSQFLTELTDVVTQANLNHGTITAGNQSGRVVLKFSSEFSPALQQQIRNTWYANS